MTLTQLTYLIALDKHRHFGKAAESCNVAQPSLSTQIQKLEEQLGVEIFARDKNHCTPTEVGMAIIEQAKNILVESDRMHDIVQSYTQEVRGSLKLGIIPTIAPFLLPSFLHILRKNYPHLKIEIYEQKTTELIQLIDRGDIDAAILSTPKTAPAALIEKVLYYEAFVLFAATNHPLHKLDKIKTSDLENYSPYLLDETHCLRDQVEQLCQNENKQDLGIQLKAGSLQTLVEITSKSNLYTLLPAMAKSYFIKNYPKHFHDLNDPKPSRKVSLVFHKSFVKRNLIQLLFQIIQENLPNEAISIQDKAKIKTIDPNKDRFKSS